MSTVNRDIQAEQEFLRTYDVSKWPHPSLTADICVFCTNWLAENASIATEGTTSVLLVQRGGHPFKGCWALPGGFSELGEEIEETAARELAEETGLSDIALERTYLYSGPKRDPRGWTASQAFVACVGNVAAKQVHAGDDAAQATWFDLQAKRTRDFLEIALSNGATTLSVQAELVFEPYSGIARARDARSNGLAFDHARLLCDAYLYKEDLINDI